MMMTNTLNGAAIVERAKAFAARRRPAPVPIDETPRAMSPEDAVRRLSDDMLDVAGDSGAATEVDLLGRGWPLPILRRFGEAARDRAIEASARRVA